MAIAAANAIITPEQATDRQATDRQATDRQVTQGRGTKRPNSTLRIHHSLSYLALINMVILRIVLGIITIARSFPIHRGAARGASAGRRRGANVFYTHIFCTLAYTHSVSADRA
jgi:hypothetical protein